MKKLILILLCGLLFGATSAIAVPNGVGKDIFTGNVGIGSLTPGQALDVVGSVRATAFVGDGSGLTGVSGGGWTLGASNIGISTTNNVGIGTNLTTTAGLTVMNGNVGIGTWVPSALFEAGSQTFDILSNGNVGIGTWLPGARFVVGSGSNYVAVDSSGNFFTPSAEITGSTFECISNTGCTVTNSNSTANNIYLDVGPTGGTGTQDYLVLRSNTSSSSTSDFIAFDVGVNGGTQAMLINTAGNIGMGTSTPAAKLNVLGNIGIGTVANGDKYLTTSPPNGGMVIEGNVGIGTWVPAYALDVNGTVRATGLTVNTGTPMPGYVLTSSDTGGDTTWSAPGAAGGWKLGASNVGISTTNNVGIGTNLTTTAGLTVMNGNVGIGTWVPSRTLEVDSSAAALDVVKFYNTNSSGYGAMFFENNLGNNGFMGIGGSTSTWPNMVYFGAANAIPFIIATSNLERARIDANGNVGIGSWGSNSIINKLDIVGNIGIGTSQGSSFLQTAAPSGGMIIQNNVGIGSVAPGQMLDVQGTVRVLGGGSVGIGTSLTATSALTVMNGNVGIGTWVPAGLLQINNLTHTPFLVDTNGNVGIGTLTPVGRLAVMNGNVGIGTWVPQYPLELMKDGATIGGTAYGSALFDEAANDKGVILGYDTSGTIGVIASDTSGTGSSLAFWTNNASGTYAERMRIDSNSNVGIGTTTPVGGLAIMNGNVGIGTWVPNAAMVVNGNIGVGTVFANNALEIGGTAEMTGFKLNNGAASGDVLVSNAVGLGTWMPTSTLPAATLNTGTANQISYYTGSTQLSGSSSMVFNSPNVGLGTVTPNATLQIIGNIGIGTIKNGDNFITTSPPNGGMIIEGNVGIGSVNPGQALDVKGTIRSISGGFTFPDGSSQTTAYRGIPNNIQVFTATGTWTKPASVSTVYVRCWGAGGAGAAGGSSVGGAGGGGGGYVEGLIGVTANVTVTIGTGSSGSTGGNTTFAAASTLTADGGTKATTTTGGGGGAASNGTINLTGGAGCNSVSVSGTGGGAGGGSPLGGAGGGAGPGGNAANMSASGVAGSVPGGGGGGGSATTASDTGAAGANGLCIVEY